MIKIASQIKFPVIAKHSASAKGFCIADSLQFDATQGKILAAKKPTPPHSAHRASFHFCLFFALCPLPFAF
jgi:hypothetical protein